jgi:hypothetical protein
MGDLSPHQLHHLVHSWLGYSDPYGRKPKIEPTMDTKPRSGKAKAAGERAVEDALAPDPRAAAAGPQSVEDALFGQQGAAQAESGRNAVYPDRASAWGEHAVDKATTPSPLDMSGAPGWQSPEEAQAWASGVGQSAVQGAVDPKAAARARMAPMFAPARTSDPMAPKSQSRARSPGKAEEEDTPSE